MSRGLAGSKKLKPCSDRAFAVFATCVIPEEDREGALTADVDDLWIGTKAPARWSLEDFSAALEELLEHGLIIREVASKDARAGGEPFFWDPKFFEHQTGFEFRDEAESSFIPRSASRHPDPDKAYRKRTGKKRSPGRPRGNPSSSPGPLPAEVEVEVEVEEEVEVEAPTRGNPGAANVDGDVRSIVAEAKRANELLDLWPTLFEKWNAVRAEQGHSPVVPPRVSIVEAERVVREHAAGLRFFPTRKALGNELHRVAEAFLAKGWILTFKGVLGQVGQSFSFPDGTPRSEPDLGPPPENHSQDVTAPEVAAKLPEIGKEVS